MGVPRLITLFGEKTWLEGSWPPKGRTLPTVYFLLIFSIAVSLLIRRQIKLIDMKISLVSGGVLGFGLRLLEIHKGANSQGLMVRQ